MNAFKWSEIPPYEWPALCSEEENVLKFARLSSDLRNALENNDDEKLRAAVEAVLDWGGVNKGEGKVDDFAASIKAIYREKRSVKDVIRMGKNIVDTDKKATWRIASWTKILAAAFPGEYFIYDARVAYGLYQAAKSIKWQIPPSERHDIEVRKDKNEGNALNMPDSYSKYLEWLQENAPEISEKLFSVYKAAGIKDKMQARMAHAEKMLFMVIERDKQK